MNMQLSLYDIFDDKNLEIDQNKYVVESFSASGFCDDTLRKKLEQKYKSILEISDKFDRQSVSYQLSKKDILHSWLKYKEGFSFDLVETLLTEMNIHAGDTILDPFLGSGTTAFTCLTKGINCIGYDIMMFYV